MVKKIKKEEPSQFEHCTVVPTKYLVIYCNRNKINITTVCFVEITDLNNHIN